MPPSRRTTGGPSSASSEAPEAGWLKGRSLFYQLEGDRFPTCWRVTTQGPKAVRLSRDDGITIQLPTKDIQQLAAGQNKSALSTVVCVLDVMIVYLCKNAVVHVCTYNNRIYNSNRSRII